MILSLKFCLTVSNNGASTRLFHNWKNFYLFWFRFGCACLWLAEEVLQNWSWFFFFVVATRLSCKTMCTITTKQHHCRFLVLEKIIQNVAADFSLFTVVETNHFFGWNVNTLFVSTWWAIYISNNLLYFAVHTHFFLSIIGWFKWDIS